MKLEQLRVLNAIVSEGTFHGAAQKLNKSQPAISLMLKNLEQEIGLTLFSRDNYRPALTAAGDVFYREATKVLHQMQQLSNVAMGLAARQEPEVCIAVSATCDLASILEIIGEINQRYQATHLRLSTESMGGSVERLMADEADIIIATMDGVPGEQVEAIPFVEVEIIPVAHPEFPPARSGRMNSTRDMQGYVQVVVADSTRGKNTQSRDLLEGGLRWTVSDFAAKKEIIRAGLGWGGIPKHLITRELEQGELVPLSVEMFPVRNSRLFQIRRREKAVGIVSQAMWERLKQQGSASAYRGG